MSGESMLAITVAQPYAAAIAAGLKRWETRPSPPYGPMRPDGVRGLPGLAIDRGERIAIHAGATWYPGWCRWYDPTDPADDERLDILDGLGAETYDANGSGALRGLPLMAVVATARVVDALPIVEENGDPPYPCIDAEAEPVIEVYASGRGLLFWGGTEGSQSDISDQIPLGDWTPGRWAWQLADVEPLADSIPCPGRQGVWRLPDDIAEEVRRGWLSRD